MFGFDLYEIILNIPVMLIAITIHELSHGWVAYKLGDPTAKLEGRLTFNPIAHIDPLGALCLILFRFGWAKPVSVNPYFFKNRKRDMAMVSLAGPVSNFLMSFAALFLLRGLFEAGMATPFKGTASGIAYDFLGSLIFLNLGLGVFNLIPIPPLDGSKILNTILPERLYFKIMEKENILYILILFLLFSGILSKPLSAVIAFLYNVMLSITSLFFGGF